MRFNGFVSYSHAADGRLAPELQRSLQRFARPWNRPSALRIFRDRTDLSVNPALWPSVERAIGESDYFLLLASPEAAASKWVHREVEFWRRNRSPEKLLLILTRGEIAWQDGVADFDWEKTTALPRNLEGLFRDQPRHIDLRWAKTEEHLSLHNTQFRDAIAEIAAPLHGKSKSELESEEVRQTRRLRRLTWLVLTGLTLLSAAAAVFGVSALRNAEVAKEQAQVAREQARVAVARMLAAEARSLLDNADAQFDLGTRLIHAVLLGAESLKRHPTPQAVEVVHRALGIVPSSVRSFDVYEGSSIALSDGGLRVVATSPLEEVRVWDVQTGKVLVNLGDSGAPVGEVAISGDGTRVARSWGEGRSVSVLDVANRRELANLTVPFAAEKLALSRDGTLLAVAYRQRIRLFNVRRRAWLRTVSPRARVAGETAGEPTSLAFTDDGHRLTVLWSNGRVQTFSTETHREAATDRDVARLDNGYRHLGAVNGDGRRVATGDGTGTIQVWDSETLAEVGRVEHVGPVRRRAYVQNVALSANGTSFAGVSRGGLLTVWTLKDVMTPIILDGPRAWRVDTDHHIALTGDGERRVLVSTVTADLDSIGGHHRSVRTRLTKSGAVAANGDGSRIAVVTDESNIFVYDTGSGREIARFANPVERYGAAVNRLALSGDGLRLAVGGDFQTMSVFDVDVPTGRRPLTRRGPGPTELQLVFALDHDGRRVAVASPDGVLTVSNPYDTRSPSKRDLPSPALLMAFSGDGQFIAMQCLDHTLRVLDAVTLVEKARILHRLTVAALAFGAGGSRLRVASVDGAVREILWRPQELVNRACNKLRRNFSRTEWSRYFSDEPFHPTCDNVEPRK